MRQVNFLPHLDEPGERSLVREIEKKESVCCSVWLSVCTFEAVCACVCYTTEYQLLVIQPKPKAPSLYFTANHTPPAKAHFSP